MLVILQIYKYIFINTFFKIEKMEFPENNTEQKLSPLNQALKECLPELMSRNIKKGIRLKSKLDVNFFLNNVELRNQSYLKKLVTSSQDNLRSIKSGLEFKKAMELTEEKLSQINYQILYDYFLTKNNVIKNAQRQLKKNTEEESNIIIKTSLHKLKHILYPSLNIKEETKKELPKKNFMTKSELYQAEEVINQKLKKDYININSRLQKYLDRVKRIKLLSPKKDNIYNPNWIKSERDKNRDFYFYADNLLINNDKIKMIHYKKLEPNPIRDKSCPNLQDLKEKIFPEIKTGNANKDDILNIKTSNSVKLINEYQIKKKFKKIKLSKDNNKNINTDINNLKINETKNDSYNTLNRIIKRNNSLSNINNNRYQKLSSLMDIKLPKLSEYDLLIKKKKLMLNKKEENKNEINNEINNRKSINQKIMNLYNEWKLKPEIVELKNDIEKLKTKKFDVEENYQKHIEEILNDNKYIDVIDTPKKIKKEKNLSLINNDSILFNIKNNNNKNMNIEIPAIRMPSSYSVQILKRKRRVNSDINIFSDKKIHREFSNFSRDRATNASTIIPSIRNSAMSSLNNNNNGKKFNEILKIMKRDKNNKNKIEQPIISLKNMKINLLTNNSNNYSSTISN